MKENKRKCCKCGSSPSEDPNVVLYRFPKPGTKNPLRAELWAKYCFPEKAWSSTEFQKKLYLEHRMMCHKHFKETSFIDYNKKLLHRHAAPNDDCDAEGTTCPTVSSKLTPLSSYLENITNTNASTTDVQSEKLDSVLIGPQDGPSNRKDLTKDCAKLSGAKRKKLNDVPLDIEPQPGPSTTIGTTAILLDHTYSAKKEERVALSLETESTKIKNRYLYDKCRKSMKKICQLRNAIKKIKTKHILNVLNEDENVKSLSKKLTPTFAILLQGQIKNCKKKPKGRRWTQEDKIVALRLYKRSPSCYRLLRRLFCLPSQSSLKILLSQFDMPVGINKKVVDVLKIYVQKQNPIDNNFVLMFDEMSIKKHLNYSRKQDLIEGFQDHGECHERSPQEATHALVFMVAGLRKTVKQPIAYYLSSAFVTADRLAVILKQVLSQCINAGINISATVCDMDGVNRRALTNLGATEQNPQITIDGKQIITLFDPPHLLKCFRNLFMKYDIKCMANVISENNSGQGIAKWSHLVDFYQMDNANPNFVFAPCLRKEHLYPNTKQKMKVKFAAQVLSHSVAAGMYAKISTGELSSDAVVTANIAANMDKLFDCLNSNSPDLRRGKPYATNLSNVSPHINFFQEMKKFFKELSFLGCRSTPPSISGWVMTLNGVEILWKNLKRTEIKSLATRRLQQDPLENLFGCIRANCGANSNPTTGQFVAGLKTAILSNLTHMAAGNCEEDGCKAIITNFKKLLSPEVPVSDPTTKEDESSLSSLMLSSTHNSFDESAIEDSGEMQACTYVCGFILKNMQDECTDCKKALYTNENEDIHNFMECKEYNQMKKSLRYAARPFVECVEKCAIKINAALSTNGHMKQLRTKFTEKIVNEINFEYLTQCPKHYSRNITYITKSVFYICIKRFCVTKNRSYAEQASMSSLKKKIDILKHV